jgi:hypothetical protein
MQEEVSLMSLFAVADGIKIRSIQLKRLSKKIRSACSDIDHLRKLAPSEEHRHHHELKIKNAMHDLSSKMKEYTSVMAEINAHLLEIRKHLKP